ncbi:MAG: hypothetical protein K6U80_18950, partial [Firmicutes bacterium]|nr:hypothetical protein [Bacillota bacterium]
MKKLLILFILISLVLLIPAYAFGAIHNFGDNYAETDNWFTITPDQPYMEAHYRSTGNSIPLTSLGFEYFLNDQTFVDFNCYKQDQGNWTYLTGSYLTGFGLFAGLELYSYTYPGYSFQRLMVSPGYRLAIDEQSYVTLSLDYYSNKSLQDIIDWEVNARYYNDKMKVFGDIISYTKPSYGTSNFNVGINYQVTKSIVVGGSLLAKEAGKDIMMGATYNSERFIIDGQIYTYN